MYSKLEYTSLWYGQMEVIYEFGNENLDSVKAENLLTTRAHINF